MKDWGHSSRLQCLPGGSDKSEADTTRTRSTKGKDSSLGHIIIRSSTNKLVIRRGRVGGGGVYMSFANPLPDCYKMEKGHHLNNGKGY